MHERNYTLCFSELQKLQKLIVFEKQEQSV